MAHIEDSNRIEPSDVDTDHVEGPRHAPGPVAAPHHGASGELPPPPGIRRGKPVMWGWIT